MNSSTTLTAAKVAELPVSEADTLKHLASHGATKDIRRAASQRLQETAAERKHAAAIARVYETLDDVRSVAIPGTADIDITKPGRCCEAFGYSAEGTLTASWARGRVRDLLAAGYTLQLSPVEFGYDSGRVEPSEIPDHNGNADAVTIHETTEHVGGERLW